MSGLQLLRGLQLNSFVTKTHSEKNDDFSVDKMTVHTHMYYTVLVYTSVIVKESAMLYSLKRSTI